MTFIESNSSSDAMETPHGSSTVVEAQSPIIPQIQVSTKLDDDVFKDAKETADGEDGVAAYAFNAEIKFKTAIKGPESNEWKEAMITEVTTLLKKETWELVTPPKDRKIIVCRFVLTNKYLPDETLKLRKVRLVAQGYSHQADCC